MKSLFNSIVICLLAIISFTSCSEAVLEKSKVEAGWSKNPSNIPTVTLGTISLEGKGQDVVVTGSSVSTSGELLESGIAFSTVETFDPSLTKYVVADSEKIGKVTAQLAPATTYFVRAYGIVAEGSAYSEVQSVTTKDIPFTDKIQGTFSGTVVSGAYGDKYTSTLILELGEE